MDLSKSKKVAMAIAAIEILLFHLWIPVFSYGSLAGTIERFIVQTGYIGVDIFFFVSAYSMAKRPILTAESGPAVLDSGAIKRTPFQNYINFLLNRFIKLAPLFLIALITGQFLWFIPALMLTYVLFPPLQKLSSKNPKSSFFLLILGWATITMALLGLVNKNQDLGIFLFRVPIIILGGYATLLDRRFSGLQKLILGLISTLLGVYLTYNLGFMNKLAFPFKDLFYVTGIPLTIGLLLLIDFLSGLLRFRGLKFIGGISLELYFTQCVLGAWLVKIILNLIVSSSILSLPLSKLATNIIILAITIVLSAMIAELFNFFSRKSYELAGQKSKA